MSLEFTFPAVVGRVFSKLPQWPNGIPASLMLNLAASLKLLPADMALLEGRTFTIAVRDLGLSVRFVYRNSQFRPLWSSQPTDLLFSANMVDYLKLIRREEDPDTLFFNRKLQIEGDTELGLTVKNLLDAMEPASLQSIGQALKQRLA